MTQIKDLVILGGGAAGLSLARRLAQSPDIKNFSVEILEGREDYINDKTWCFFAPVEHELTYLCAKSWPAFSLSSGDREVRMNTPETPYQCIRSIDFYRDSLERINSSRSLSLRLGTKVSEIYEHKDYVRIETSQGQIHARYVLDTRPPGFKDFLPPILRQAFFGLEISTSHAIFNDDEAGLMRDLQSDQYGLSFLYCLPFSPTHALLEWTRFTPYNLDKDHLEEEAKSKIDKILKGDEYEVVREEFGVIPMARMAGDLNKKKKRIINAGGRGGAVRPSTGYAFLRIQRWSKTCAESFLQSGRPVAPESDSWYQSWMDKIYLKVLEKNPDLGPDIKMNMANSLKSQQFTRFLSDKAYFWDNICVIKSQPIWPFLKTAFLDILGKK